MTDDSPEGPAPESPTPLLGWHSTDFALCMAGAALPIAMATATPERGALPAMAQITGLLLASLFLGMPLLVQTRAARILSHIHALRDAARRGGDVPSSSQVLVAAPSARRPLPPRSTTMLIATFVPLIISIAATLASLKIWPTLWSQFVADVPLSLPVVAFLACFALWPTSLSLVGAFRVLGQHRHHRVMEPRHMTQALLAQILWSLVPPLAATASCLTLLRYGMELGTFTLAAAVGALLLFGTTLLAWLTWRFAEQPK